MAIYSIGDMEKLSGIKAHTIRMWEQRYGVLSPKRTETNIRYYEDDDLLQLLNISLLNRNGYKISVIAAMSQEDIAGKATEVSDVEMGVDARLDVLTLAVIEMDEYKFTRIFDNEVEQKGFERTMLEVVYPFMEKLGLLWLTGSIKPVQQHFITQLVRNKLIAAIEKEPLVTDRNAPKFLLYLPQGEQQELNMLFVQYLLKARKFQVINIGHDTGLTDLKDACRIHPPGCIFTILSETFTKEPIQRYLENLAEAFPESRLLITGYMAASGYGKAPANAVIFSGLEDVTGFLDRLGG